MTPTQAHPSMGKTCQTQAATAAAANTGKASSQTSPNFSNATSAIQYEEEIPQPPEKHPITPDEAPSSIPSPFHIIANVLKKIIIKDNMLSRLKKHLEKLLMFLKKEESKEGRAASEKEEQLKMSNFHKCFRADLLQMYEAIDKHLTGIQTTTLATLTSVEGAQKAFKATENLTEAIMTKISEVMDITVKIVTDTSSYRDTL